MVHLFDLPFDILSHILKFSCGIRALGLLDSSVLNKSLRKEYLRFLKSRVFRVNFSIENISATESFVNYLVKREVYLTTENLKFECEIRVNTMIELIQRMTKLRSLDCAHSLWHITADNSLCGIVDFCPDLTYLDLSFCNLTDVSVSRLGSCCTALKVLNLSGCYITDTSVRSILERCSMLTSLNLNYCRYLTEESVYRAAEHFSLLNSPKVDG